MAPKRLLVDLSDNDASEDESANRQLLDEAYASTPRFQMPEASAARSASLLNAVRVERRSVTTLPIRSSPPRTSSPVGPTQSGNERGKLKRIRLPSSHRSTISPSQQEGRRRDVYDPPGSPERERSYISPKPASLTQTKGPKKVGRPRKAKPAEKDQATELAPTSLQQSSARDSVEVRVVKTHDSLNDRNTRSDDPKHNTTQVPRHTEFEQTEDVPPIVEDQPNDTVDDDAHPKAQKPRGKRKRGKDQDQVAETTNGASESTTKRMTRAKAAQDAHDARSGKRSLNKAEQGSEPRPSETSKAKVNSTKQSEKAKSAPRNTQQKLPEENEDTLATVEQPDDTEPVIGEVNNRNAGQEGNSEDHKQNEHVEEVDEDLNGQRHDSVEQPQLNILDRVFTFLDSGQRSGQCSTQEGVKIRKVCSTARKTISKSESTIEELVSACERIRTTLSSSSRVKNSASQRELKTDAYAHLFFSLARVLEVVHDRLQEHYGDLLRSAPALQVILPLIRSMLTFKRTITSWNVSITQSYQGQNIAKTVIKNFIVPLRDVAAELHSVLEHLVQKERSQKERDDYRALQKQREEEDQRLQEVEEELRRWKKWWSQLHVTRLLCEPSISRRRRLAHQPLTFAAHRNHTTNEIDANGVPFERENFFNHSSSAKPSFLIARPSLPEDKEWTSDQLEALFDGLRLYANAPGVEPDIPGVFEKIFERYCGPGRVLCDFNVAEITEEAAKFKTLMLSKCESEGWTLEQWIETIPVLP